MPENELYNSKKENETNMRSFINWSILERIKNSPKEYIVQRKVSLLNAFLYGYEYIYLKVDNIEQLEVKYDHIPSIEDYVRKKYNANHIGTRNFESIISFTCEDERDFFYRYYSCLEEYDRTFPIEETISYALVKTPRFTLHELLTGIRNRFPMYFGNYDISGLRAFLDGYFLCKKEYDILLTTYDKKVKAFTDGIVSKDLNLSGEFVTWDRLYRYDRDWKAWGEIDDRQAKEILESFWNDLDAFAGQNDEE